ncbi:MAG: HAD family phosphatase [Gemmatimonadetes bacterium]|nr:HAD family phosphatase [Gemmatimonadota bacterium]MBK7784440.1 HAD family phosphatase [Gemmatimonadota bacterium]MBP9202196.1 HAD family phosphatase [Gemmatimonadales bacterium]
MPRAILFDFNGVIVNDEPQHCEALIATLASYGYPLDREGYYRDYLGFDDRECFRFTFERMGRPADAAQLHEAIERKAVLYERAIRASLELVPGSAGFIRAAAAAGYRMAVVSGALRREIDLVLSAANLQEHFPVVVAAEDVDQCKPDPQGYRAAQEALGVASERCVVIEDSLPGLEAARRAGARCAMITTSHPAADLAGADLVWDSLEGHHPDELPWRS